MNKNFIKIGFSALIAVTMFFSSQSVSNANSLNDEAIQNYKFMGMSNEEIDKINEELKNTDDPNFITETEKDFYINKMGIKESDLNQMIEDANNTNNSGYETRVHGTYPREKGIILVTKDKLSGVVPLGHAAIIYNSNLVIEANPGKGVHYGYNDWNEKRNTVYGLKVHKVTAAQRANVTDWCSKKCTLPYNPFFNDVETRSKFYCSQLVWAGFKDIYNVDLNGGQYGKAIYPPEMIDSGYVYRIYIKGDGY